LRIPGENKTNSLLAPYKEWPIAPSAGKLVRVEVAPGRLVQMYEDQARKKGLLPPEDKAEEPKQNKGRHPRRQKAEE
jgi:hypothetical protein